MTTKENLDDHFESCPACGSWELEYPEGDEGMIWCNGCGRWVHEEEEANECNRTKSA